LRQADRLGFTDVEAPGLARFLNPAPIPNSRDDDPIALRRLDLALYRKTGSLHNHFLIHGGWDSDFSKEVLQ
jgi:hypothetical protein